MHKRHFRCLAIMFISAFSTTTHAAQYCEKTNYSAQEITNAVNNSALRNELKSTSCSLGGLGRFESGGNKGIYNESCCTGIFQLNNSNIKKYANGMTREQFGCQSLQFQADTWAKLTNDGYSSGTVSQLMAMGTFDGQKVDAGFVASCIQLGTGNCQKMLNSGRCSGFQDSNGTTICDMAKNARSLADPKCQNDSGSSGSNGGCPSGPGDFPTTPAPTTPAVSLSA